MNFYEELKGWQGGIGSLLGFLALIVGALWNFRLNRRRDAALRAEEVVSVAAALYGEIVLLRIEAAGLARAVANVATSVGNATRTHHQIRYALCRFQTPQARSTWDTPRFKLQWRRGNSIHDT
jgi:hypothetical protein